jgi:hypothetical protein
MKYLLPLILFSASLQAAEIESVEVGTNTMLITGNGLGNIKRATLARKPVGILPISDAQTVIYCQCERWPVGVRRLRLFAPLYKLRMDVTVTGQELDNQPPVLPDERPQPAG